MAQIPSSVLDLIEKFNTQSELYKSPTYNEAQLRIDFINPMFKALGWDIDNTKGYAEAFREVVYEDAVMITGTTKSPDYSFRIGGERCFFLEAKKPAINIKDDVEPAYQLRRYGWSKKLPLSILTNFAEFAVYDCYPAPKYLDKASTARLMYFTYADYPQKWDEIAAIFSPEGIQHGAYHRYAESNKKSGTQDFDDVFLDEMEDWRKKLASNLALRNELLDEPGLNFATQRIIDRIIFLRICEDRGVEPPFQLQALLSSDNVYPRLRGIFEKADQRYNSGLFHFHREKDRNETPDELTPGLEIDDAVLKQIIKRLYYPDSPYVFKEVAADILGNVYERFLGNVIHLTAGHRAKVEPKPEVRKAGGVYYTPKYIVDFIVHNTVGA
ncbi:MAG: restriction endonuclease subunit M, partial [Tepidisphaerales bacterium]